MTLTGSSVVNGQLVLNVDTERNSAASTVNALPTFTLLSGGSELTSFQLPVVGMAMTDF
ncbi:MAG: hypothetical protein ACR2J4_11225 [Deinococcus sp.]